MTIQRLTIERGPLVNRYIASLQILAALLILPVAACSSDDAGATTAADSAVVALQPTDLAVARIETLAEGVLLTGTLNPYRIAEVRAQVPGLVSSIRVDNGDGVSQGQVMAVLSAQGIRSGAAGARAQVASAQANVALAEQRYESSRILYEAGAISQIDFQTAEAGLEAARGQLAAAEAQAASASESARQATITAPFAGEVSGRMINIGEAVSPGDPLFTVVNASTLELAGHIPVAEATSVRPGQRVEFALDAYPGRVFVGDVERVDPVADPATRRVGVYLRMPNTGRALVGGLFATGRIITGAQDSVLVVPVTAVRNATGAAYVWVVENETLQRREVTVGTTDPARGLVAIESGLEAGDQVLVAPGEPEPGARIQMGGVPTASPEETEAEQ